MDEYTLRKLTFSRIKEIKFFLLEMSEAKDNNLNPSSHFLYGRKA
jgi:hypothetical protein